MIKVLLLFSLTLLSGCLELFPSAPLAKVALSWETEPDGHGVIHKDAVAWTAELDSLVRAALPTFSKASDRASFCAKYDQLSDENKAMVWDTMFVEIARYESGFNPKATGVDVGTDSDRNTWSVGLFQMSQTDQANYKLDLGYAYFELMDPVKNLRLAIPIAEVLVSKAGLVSGGERGAWKGMARYWSTVRDNTKLPKIKATTNALSFCK